MSVTKFRKLDESMTMEDIQVVVNVKHVPFLIPRTLEDNVP